MSDLKARKTNGWRMTMRMSVRECGFILLIAEVMPSSMALQASSKFIPASPDGTCNEGSDNDAIVLMAILVTVS